MKEMDIKKLEVSLGYSLPQAYRQFLLNHSDELNQVKKVLSFYAVLWTTPKEIVKGNKLVRKYARDMTIGKNEDPWLENYMVVGTNGGGDYWFIHKDDAKTALWFWNHETQNVKRYDTTFDRYLSRLRKAMRTPEKWQ
jgi:hypothetical protein